jgi:hypothetical protein
MAHKIHNLEFLEDEGEFPLSFPMSKSYIQSTNMVLLYFYLFPSHRLILSGHGQMEGGGDSFTLTCLKGTQTPVISFILHETFYILSILLIVRCTVVKE